MEMNFQRIAPLWETFPSRVPQEAGRTEGSGASFSSIFQALVNNVREAEDEVAKKEYLLSTGQLDNPAEMSMATYKAETAMALLVNLRDKALSAYGELSRISL